MPSTQPRVIYPCAMKRGEVWWVSLPDPVGSALGYRRRCRSCTNDQSFSRKRSGQRRAFEVWLRLVEDLRC